MLQNSLKSLVVMSGMKETLKTYFQKDIRMNTHQTANSLKKKTLWTFGLTVVPHGTVS